MGSRFWSWLVGGLLSLTAWGQSPIVRFQQDRFVIGSWVEPPLDARADDRYREMAAAGFNTVIAGFSELNFPRFEDILRRHDLRALISAPSSNPTNWPTSPVIWGYSLKDEPGAAEFPQLAARVAAVREAQPGKLAFINLFPDYASAQQLGTATYEEHVSRFLREVNVDVLCMDHYPIFHPDRDGRDGYCRNLAVLRQQALTAGIPFWNFFNTMPYGPHTDPTESQLRWQVFASLCYGAKGVLYFCYYTPRGDEFPKGGAIIARDDQPTRHYEQAQRLNAKLMKLGPTLMKLTSTGVYRIQPTDSPAEVLKGSGLLNVTRDPVDPPPDYLIGSFRHADGRRAVLLMNYRFAFSAWPTVVFDAPVDQVRELDQRTGRELPVRDESPDLPGLQISLADGEGRLFLLPPLP
ncbi:MAG: hypothetical protein J0M24_26265 [Verrucomicrobia bacterium]|nr:hypothetical protein [Verrucomicrobiota bacterium]